MLSIWTRLKIGCLVKSEGPQEKKSFESLLEKGESTGNHHFLPSPKVFSTLYLVENKFQLCFFFA